MQPLQAMKVSVSAITAVMDNMVLEDSARSIAAQVVLVRQLLKSNKIALTDVKRRRSKDDKQEKADQDNQAKEKADKQRHQTEDQCTANDEPFAGM